ncbi:MAG: hypothetical protein RBS02_17285 [Steroidobacteraceae bacterium]|jgi:hypothetical protein|nr:hypothetical protein [Steroidobacteraceae bacterium]
MTTLTEMQAQALECLEGARSAGVALSGHVRSRGLNLRGIYDAIAQLRRRGIVPPAPRRVRKRVAAASTPVRFAKVEVRSAPAPLRLRLLLGNGRGAELEVEDPEQLSRIVAALEASRS